MVLLRFICLLALLGPAALPAAAQESARRERPRIGEVRVGLAGSCPPDRWAPVRVSITPGTRPFSGFLFAEFPQDGTQDARVVVRAAATPGLESSVEFAAALPAEFTWLNLTLRDDSGREVSRLEIDTMDIGSPMQLAQLHRAANALVCVGEVSAVLALGRTQILGSGWGVSATPVEEEAKRAHRLGSLSALAVGAEDLPRSWAAYDACEALVVRPEDSTRVDHRAIDAVRAWVQAGGRLVLVVDRFGDVWRRWAPGGVEGFVTLDERRPVEAELLRDIVDAAASQRIDLSSERGGADAPASPVQAPGRLIRISEDAARDGWRLRWNVGEGAGLVAEGPVGFGWVTLLGIDPGTIVRGEDAASRKCWADALQGAIEPYLRRSEGSGASFGYAWRDDSGLASVLDHIAGGKDGRGLGAVTWWPFVAMSVLMLALAIAIGPLDAIGLRALKARHRSWLTALAWIGAATLVGLAMPAAFRAGSSDKDTLGRVEVIDILVDAREGRQSFSPVRTGVSGYFSASSRSWRVEGLEPGSFARGASSVYRWGRSRSWMPPFETVHRSEASGAGFVSSQFPGDSIGQGQWTFRAFIDDGPASGSRWSPVAASLSRSGDEVRLRLSNLPAGARPESLTIGKRRYRLEAAGAGEFLAVELARREVAEPVRGVERVAQRVELLPQVMQRWTSISRRLEGESWGVLRVLLEAEPEVTAGPEAVNWGVTLARILIPVRGEEP